MTPIEQAQAILGEHFRNYVLITQDADVPSHFDCYYSDPYATTGLLLEASKYHHAQMNSVGGLCEDWEWEEDEEEEEEEDDYDFL
jgi:hypothetical protein